MCYPRVSLGILLVCVTNSAAELSDDLHSFRPLPNYRGGLPLHRADGAIAVSNPKAQHHNIMGTTLEEFIASEPKAAAKIEHAIQDYKHARNDLSHALEDLKHAKQDTAHALQDFDHLINDFEHALSDWEAGGKQAGHAKTDFEHAGSDKSHAEKDLEHALKDINHALNDFKHSTRDLKHLDEDLEAVVALAKKADVENMLADAKAYVAAQTKS